jgi:hypothetical protein
MRKSFVKFILFSLLICSVLSLSFGSELDGNIIYDLKNGSTAMIKSRFDKGGDVNMTFSGLLNNYKCFLTIFSVRRKFKTIELSSSYPQKLD